MANIRRSVSISDATLFQEAVGELVDSSVLVTQIKESDTVNRQLAEAASLACFHALCAAIDGYCANKIAETVSNILGR